MSDNEKPAKVAKNSGKFKAGDKKPENSGRKKGTPNKKTKELMEILGSFNPAEKLVEIYNNTEDDKLKADICKDLMKYIYPQRKAVDMDLNTQGGVNVVVDAKTMNSVMEKVKTL